MKYKCYFIIFTFLNFVTYLEQIHSIIVLPFQLSELKEEDVEKFNYSTNDFFTDFVLVDYYSSLIFGQKEIRFLARISADNDTFFLSEKECQRQSVNNVKNYYIMTKNNYKLRDSSTYQNISKFNNSLTNYKNGGIISENFIFYNTTKLKSIPLSYDNYYDKDQIDTKINVNETKVIIEEFTNNGMCAVVGFGKTNINSKEGINFINELKRNQAITDYSYTFKFITSNSGEFIIGALPHEYFNNSNLYKEYQFIKINSYSNNKFNLPWSLTFDKILLEYNNNTINIQINAKSFIAPHLGFIIGTTQYKKLIMEKYFNSLINKGICSLEKTNKINNKLFDLENEYFEIFSCDISKMKNEYKSSFPKIIFQHNNFDFNFFFFFYCSFIEFKGRYYFLIIFPEDNYPNNNWYLGLPFLKRYQFIFNYDSKTIGFYNENLKQKNETKINNSNNSHLRIILEVGIGILLIALIIIAFIIGQKISKQRKKRANELTDDNFEYFSKEGNNQENNLNLGV